MPKFMVRASYSSESLKGLMQEDGTSRRDALKTTVESVGGTLEDFHYGFGESDLYLIVDMPDQETMAAIALTMAPPVPSPPTPRPPDPGTGRCGCQEKRQLPAPRHLATGESYSAPGSDQECWVGELGAIG